jgi:hypothetical protein
MAFYSNHRDIYGQDDLTKEDAFFQKESIIYQQFLEKTELNKVLQVGSVQTFEDLVILNLTMTDYSDWANLSRQYEADFETDIRYLLFQKGLFLFELGEDSLGIRIWSNDYKDCAVQMRYVGDTLRISENPEKGTRKDEVILKKKYLPKITSESTTTGIEICKRNLKKGLENHYKKRGEYVKTVFVMDKPNVMKVKISNMKKEILEGSWFSSYWEHLEFNFTFKMKSGNLLVTYTLDAKYGSGVFRPRKGDYRDMDFEYKEDVDDYLDKIRPIILKYLKKS